MTGLDAGANRYELAGYCELSANPVGELVLHVFGAATPERIALSDRVCTGLQLVEHWQDVGEDARRGRVYLPAEDLERFGVAEDDLLGARTGERLRRLLAFEVARARRLLDEGAPLPAVVLAFPVGFIGAAEAKEALIGREPAVAHIALRGRRGGSALAAAAVNALAVEAE